ncbi:type I polyketide synthase [Actinomadura harenae]|uniref:SDR family NAD(P)-dependent oxidoreductase n=1 Tax=Actinomadura harenae TaxID=2483351 RepID=A0A3M2M744_9ACTN|nr:type I polyketide synthase [Actinomadura harenae]RMI44673.1 SDR family NAD(P)-dependent oxidoreductase [Actinomadura harenae]
MHSREGIGEDAIRRYLVEQIARRSRVEPSEVDPDRPLEEFGLASRDAVAVAGELEQLLGRALPATLVWEHPTINRLSAALANGADLVVPAATPAPVARVREDEPIAVVGVGLRMPGGGERDLTGADDFWRFLLDRGDGVSEVPGGRWDPFDDGSPEVGDLLARTTRLGGFLSDIAGFDAEFFGITPREAAVMDPQQRLVLEVAWEAFEHAGLAPAALRGTRTGVFVGVSAPEYAAFTASDLAALEPFTATGAALSVIAGRLSYLLDLRGPSMIVDTACSSSLVSTHLAVQALRSGEADVALASGVNVLLSPTVTMTFDLAGGTASDGHCKAFDASADGMVRAEGCGAVVLKRLADAERDGDRVLAVVRGTGVNSDGRSNGLVAPNSEAQKALLRDVYATAGIDTREVDYVEAHGTGTFLGDPIEARALGEVLGVGRDADRPLLIGSVKSNLGHMEAAAGVAGLVKAVLALHHGVIPPSAHYKEPNPHIPFDDLRLAVVAEETPWPRRGHARRAGVSGFGFGGTNAHVLLEEAPAAEVAREDVPVRIYPLSDTSDERVRAYAAELLTWLDGQDAQDAHDADLGGRRVADADLARTLRRRDGRGRARAAVAARDRAGLVDGLRALVDGRPHPGLVSGTAVGVPGRPVWVFSGYGAQRAGMAQRLLEEEPAFAEAIDDLDALFAEEGGPELWAVLEEGEPVEGGPAATMPLLFAIQIGLARMWAAYGVTPGAVVGHSMGEVAAAVVAGKLSLADGVRVICRRSRLLDRLIGGGAMAVLGASAADVARLADGLDEVYAAVHSSPKQTVVTGDAAQVAEVVRRAEAEGRLARTIKAEGAGHSPQVDPLLPDLRDALAEIGAKPGTPLADGVRLYTTALDDPRADVPMDAEYWAHNLRNPVRLTDAIAAAADDGHRTFIEVNAHPILSHAVGETLDGVGAFVTHTLKRAPRGQETDDTLTFHARLAGLAAHGHAITTPGGGAIADVPSASWRHERHWIDTSRRGRGAGRDEHPLLGAHVELPGEDRHAWRADVGTAAQPWITPTQGLSLLPPAAFAEMALAAGAEALGVESVRVNSLWIERPLALDASTTVTTTFGEDEQRVEIHALTPAGTWTRLASADVGEDHHAPASPLDGPATEIAAAQRGSRHYRLHPEVFERALAVLYAEAGGDALVETIGSLRVHGPTHRGGHVRATVDGDQGDLRILGPDGQVLVEATGITLRRADRAGLPVPLADKLAEVVWDASETPEAVVSEASWSLLADDTDPFATDVADELNRRGQTVTRQPLDAVPSADVHGVVLLAGDLADEELVLAVARTSVAMQDGPRLYVATRDALPVLPGEAGKLRQAHVRALTRVLAFERTVQRATVVDAARAEDLVTELLADTPSRETAYRDGTRRTARLDRARLPAHPAGDTGDTGATGDSHAGSGDSARADARAVTRKRRRVVRRGGAYVITGGYGGIGLVTARLLAERGAARIVLSGRSGPSADAEKAIARMREDGVDVGVVLGDIAEPGVAERLVEAAREGGATLRGIVHGAGAIDDRMLADLGPDDLHRVWGAKVDGARALSEATWDAELDWFVLHSSAAALLGSPGQAAYAAANAALDALAAHRRAHGRPATSIGWGTWSQVGGAADLRVAVIEPITPDEGAEALEALLAADATLAGVLRFDPSAAVGLFPEITKMPYFAALTEAAEGQVVDAGDWPGIEAVRALPPDEARARIAAQVRWRIASVLGFAPDRLDPSVPLTDLGLDSLVAVRIKSGVEHDLGLTVPASVLLKGASVDVFEEWAAEELGLAGASAPTTTTAVSNAVSNAEFGYVMARDAAERLAVRFFEDVLGLDRVSVVADFHADLGGTAEQADQVVALLLKELGGEATRGELFATPTAENVAEYIRAADEEAARQIVRPLKPSGDRRPLFIAHPAGGTTACYRQLIDLLGDDQPVYGLERFDDAPSVEERAARYAEQIVEVQPEGAFRLAGWSFGGVLAYETARRLREAGREVEFVALFDAGLPLPVDDESDTLARRFAAFTDYINETYDLDVALTYEELSGLPEEQQFALVMERAAPLAELIPPAALHHQLTSHQDTRSLEAYEPRPYDGRVILYYAPEETPWAVKDARYVLDGTNGFGPLCPALEKVVIPGVHHLNLLDPPGVEILAAHLDGRLAADTASDGSAALSPAH